ncbi:hypothetical protein IWX46DRAFT_607457, partial [Phyllosticta citricarpa]
MAMAGWLVAWLVVSSACMTLAHLGERHWLCAVDLVSCLLLSSLVAYGFGKGRVCGGEVAACQAFKSGSRKGEKKGGLPYLWTISVSS